MTDKTNATAAPLAVKLLTAADILSADDFKFEDVQCPEWGGVVRIRNLTGEGRGVFISRNMEGKRAMLEWAQACKEAKDAGQPEPPKPAVETDSEVALVAMAACDAEGGPIFSAQNVAKLKQKSAVPLARCSEVAQRLSGLMPEQQAAAAINSEATPS
jgi:hypothetical protein